MGRREVRSARDDREPGPRSPGKRATQTTARARRHSRTDTARTAPATCTAPETHARQSSRVDLNGGDLGMTQIDAHHVYGKAPRSIRGEVRDRLLAGSQVDGDLL